MGSIKVTAVWEGLKGVLVASRGPTDPRFERAAIDSRDVQKGDLFFAGVIAKKVVLVGKNHIRALSLDDGRQLWAITTGDNRVGGSPTSCRHSVPYRTQF